MDELMPLEYLNGKINKWCFTFDIYTLLNSSQHVLKCCFDAYIIKVRREKPLNTYCVYSQLLRL